MRIAMDVMIGRCLWHVPTALRAQMASVLILLHALTNALRGPANVEASASNAAHETSIAMPVRTGGLPSRVKMASPAPTVRARPDLARTNAAKVLRAAQAMAFKPAVNLM
jgi:hypothetical protein